jgi:AcrR family transcriptional regulator
MSPRPYRLGQRQAATDQTRARILGAARDLLMAPEGVSAFSIDAVARQADVARMTVYYQFGSRAGLLEALFDDLAARGGMERMPEAFQQADPLDALDTYIAAFCRFWASGRLVLRRLRGLAALDAELEGALRARNEWRRTGLTVIAGRIAQAQGQPAPDENDDVVTVLHMLTSFESVDALAGDSRGPEDVAPLIQRLARAALTLDTMRSPVTDNSAPAARIPAADASAAPDGARRTGYDG